MSLIVDICDSIDVEQNRSLDDWVSLSEESFPISLAVCSNRCMIVFGSPTDCQTAVS